MNIITITFSETYHFDHFIRIHYLSQNLLQIVPSCACKCRDSVVPQERGLTFILCNATHELGTSY